MKPQRAWIQLQPELALIQVTIIEQLKQGYEVQLKSGMKVKIGMHQLVRLIDAPIVVKPKVSYERKHVPTHKMPVLDLHGETVIEAKIAIDQFLRLQKPAMKVEIVFGKGTGALKKALTPYVKNHRHVGHVYVNHLRAAFEITTKQ
ncbi:MAG: Smr/MutS family protein [Culicoidibacterales bacterium]